MQKSKPIFTVALVVLLSFLLTGISFSQQTPKAPQPPSQAGKKKGPSPRGAQSAELRALENRVNALEARIRQLEQRVNQLSAGGGARPVPPTPPQKGQPPQPPTPRQGQLPQPPKPQAGQPVPPVPPQPPKSN